MYIHEIDDNSATAENAAFLSEDQQVLLLYLHISPL
jgi:hypothetical protein